MTRDAEADVAIFRKQSNSPLDLAKAIAERAANGALPVEGRFWTQALIHHVRSRLQLCPPVRRFFVRLHEAPFERRLSLLDTLAALEVGLL